MSKENRFVLIIYFSDASGSILQSSAVRTVDISKE